MLEITNRDAPVVDFCLIPKLQYSNITNYAIQVLIFDLNSFKLLKNKYLVIIKYSNLIIFCLF